MLTMWVEASKINHRGNKGMAVKTSQGSGVT